MLSTCIILAFFVVVFPVSNGLLPKCHLTCNDPGPLSDLMRIEFYFFRTIYIDCSIRTPHSSNCTLDVSDIIQSSCNQNESSSHMLMLVCDNTLYRPIITNRQNRYCQNYYGVLWVIKCALLWQDLEAYGEFLPLAELHLEDYKDRWDQELMESDYWKKHLDLRGENESRTTAPQIEPVEIPPGLREVRSLTMVNMDNTPGILQKFIWPWTYEVVFNNSQLSTQIPNSRLQISFPKLQSLGVISCNLTQPPSFFALDNMTLVSPGNLSQLEKFLTSTSISENYFNEPSFWLDGNRISDLSNSTLKGNEKHFH